MLSFLLAPYIKQIQASMPKISLTEREALEAGSVWWDGELFSGNPNWKKLLAMPAATLTAEEREFLNGPVEQLCSMIDAWSINFVTKDIPPEIWTFIKQNKFFGLMIPKQYGGLEFSALAHSEILAKIAGKSATVASTVSVPNSLGPAELILHYGTQEQKDKYLKKLSIGEEVPCFALTAPEAGSDAGSITDNGIICNREYNGKMTLGILLNWDKRYITLAPVATVMGLAFKLFDPEHLLGPTTDLGITCALIPTNTKGVTIGQRHWPLTTMFQNGPTQGHDVFVPIDHIIGGPTMAGRGWKMLVESLSCGRAISLPSVTAGKANVLTLASGAYARIRKQFNTAIGNFEGIEEPLTRMLANAYLTTAARRITAATIDNGVKPTVPGAIIKCHVTERCRKMCIDAMDIHGGKGIMLGPKNYIAEGYLSAPIAITVEGANILTRSLIIFGQGAIRCHPYIMQELTALEQTDSKLASKQFSKLLLKHLGYSICNLWRASTRWLTRGVLVTVPVDNESAKYFRWVSWASSAFAVLADTSLLVVGGKLKFKEKLSARLGDLLSMLYLCSTTLKQYADDGYPEEDAVVIEWIIKDLLNTFWSTAHEILANFPNRFIAIMLRIFIMPFGIPIQRPSDKLGHKLAVMLQTANATRDRLLINTYMSANELNPAGQLEIALKYVIAAEDIEHTLNRAIKDKMITGLTFADQIAQAASLNILTNTEISMLERAHTARAQIIAVDDFAVNSIATQSAKNKGFFN